MCIDVSFTRHSIDVSFTRHSIDVSFTKHKGPKVEKLVNKKKKIVDDGSYPISGIFKGFISL